MTVVFRDSSQTKTVGCCVSELTRKRFLVLNSSRSEWHRFIQPAISMHTTLAASNHRQFIPLVTAVQRMASHQTIGIYRALMRLFSHCPHLLSFSSSITIFFCRWSFFLFRNANSFQMVAFQGDKASIIQWGSEGGWGLHSSGKGRNFNQYLPPSANMNNALCSRTLSQLE